MVSGSFKHKFRCVGVMVHEIYFFWLDLHIWQMYQGQGWIDFYHLIFINDLNHDKNH